MLSILLPHSSSGMKIMSLLLFIKTLTTDMPYFDTKPFLLSLSVKYRALLLLEYSDGNPWAKLPMAVSVGLNLMIGLFVKQVKVHLPT